MKVPTVFLIAGMTVGACTSHDSSSVHENTMADSIRQALNCQLNTYPVSKYQDIYKNFMQDFFGPGHMLTDTAAAASYLREELDETETFGGPDYEYTGFRGNFVRVNLKLVGPDKIPYDVFFTNFVASVQEIAPPTAAQWEKTWSTIDSVVKELDLNLPDEESFRVKIAEQMKTGKYVVHHSKAFSDSVNFHYRIIERERFKREILPFIEKPVISKHSFDIDR